MSLHVTIVPCSNYGRCCQYSSQLSRCWWFGHLSPSFMAELIFISKNKKKDCSSSSSSSFSYFSFDYYCYCHFYDFWPCGHDDCFLLLITPNDNKE